jgi:ATP-dependent Clp protease ATP-binding subunit ClpB
VRVDVAADGSQLVLTSTGSESESAPGDDDVIEAELLED